MITITYLPGKVIVVSSEGEHVVLTNVITRWPYFVWALTPRLQAKIYDYLR